MTAAESHWKPLRLFLVISLACIALAVAWVPRQQSAANRPMHTDEAIQAWMAAEIIDGRGYTYTATDYHGPTLPYLTATIMVLRGNHTFTTPDDADARAAAIACGLLLVLVAGCWMTALGVPAGGGAMLFAATSPLLAYYGGYLIHESLFAAMIWGSLLLVLLAGKNRQRPLPFTAFLIASGIGFGLTIATKETWVLAAASACAAGAALLLLPTIRHGAAVVSRSKLAQSGAVFAAATLVTALLTLTSLLSDPGALREAARSLGVYLGRGIGGGEATMHDHPWYWHLRNILWYQEHPRMVFSEALLLIPAAANLLRFRSNYRSSIARNTAVLFVAVFTFTQIMIYSVLPYKTPWLMITPWFGIVLLAGAGIDQLWRLRPTPKTAVALVSGVTLIAGLHFMQSLRATGNLASDSRVPWAYAHSQPGVVKLAGRIRDLAGVSRTISGEHPFIWVAADQYWPLPWYLRDQPRIAFSGALPHTHIPVPILVTDVDRVASASQFVGEDAMTAYYGLLPERPLVLHVQRELWDEWVRTQETSP